MQPIIYFASDHAGFELKNKLVEYVRDELKYEVKDCGADTYNKDDDFTTFIATAAREVSAAPLTSKAIILGGSGQGEAMLANRFHDVRATVFYGGDREIITLSRKHNDANILSLGARFVQEAEAKDAVALWLGTPHEPVAKYDHRIDEMETESEKSKTVLQPDVLVRTLVPSLPAQSFDEIAALLISIEGSVAGIQIDIVDGLFAPYVSWPFTEENVKAAFDPLSAFEDFEIEIDCMCMHPENYLEVFVALGIQRVVIHAGSTKQMDLCIAHAREHGYKLGLAVRNDTPPDVLSMYALDIDFVQVMGIKEIGKQGEPFDPQTLDTVRHIRSLYPYLEIAVDGGVNAQTIPALLQAGANRFAPGSAIVKAEDPVVAYKQLAQIVGL